MIPFSIGKRRIGPGHPTYFIADVAANHDGSLERAKELIHLAAAGGADAAKFQHFKAATIVSKEGFENLGGKFSHQAKWKQSVFEVYKQASIPWEWTEVLVETCREAGIDFFTSPYDQDYVDRLDQYMPAYKIGSGDITWLEIIEHMARKGKPVFVAAGASTLVDVQNAMDLLRSHDVPVVLMQCNTNYTASLENFKYVRLRVLDTFRSMFPWAGLGLSDHTPGHATVLGAVALGACAVEKHFTDDQQRVGPDHAFSMTPATWKDMVDRTRELEAALGDGAKVVEENERETVVVQRRSVRAAQDLPPGTVLKRGDVEVLRPCPLDSIPANDVSRVIGKKLTKGLTKGDVLSWHLLE
ncbi:N-acetylneuraminate synthase [Verrucomicrobiaceae bacterium SCGC AG-212-N21]|nr:N-acetylneuraminate synthase [Verrucomicrobiaceae bacterium SCGC AG-212-N21]